jgi:hypothetical protein
MGEDWGENVAKGKRAAASHESKKMWKEKLQTRAQLA